MIFNLSLIFHTTPRALEEILSPKIKQLHNPVNTESNFYEIKQIEFAGSEMSTGTM